MPRSGTGKSCSISTASLRSRARTGSGPGRRSSESDLDRALLRLSRGGKDAAVVREFDLHTPCLRRGWLRPTRGKGARRVARTARPYSCRAPSDRAWPRGPYTRAHRPALAARNGSARRARPVRDRRKQHDGSWCASDRQTGAERINRRRAARLLRHGCPYRRPRRHAGAPRPAARMPWVQLHRNHLSVRLRRPWTVDDVMHDTDTVLTIAPPRPAGGKSRLHGPLAAGTSGLPFRRVSLVGRGG